MSNRREVNWKTATEVEVGAGAAAEAGVVGELVGRRFLRTKHDEAKGIRTEYRHRGDDDGMKCIFTSR